jgi:hypothetical protein
MSTSWNASFTDELPSVLVEGSAGLTLQNIKNRISTYQSGSTGGPFLASVSTGVAAASGTLTATSSLVATDVAGVLINNVLCAPTISTSANNGMTQIRNRINSGGDTPNALVSKAVYATRTFTPGVGTLTMASVAPGVATVTIGGTAINFTATGVNANDALACANAINADGVAGLKVRATASGAVCTITAEATPRAIVTIAGSPATGELVAVLINGILVSTTYLTSVTVTAAALALAINRNALLQGVVRATSAAGVVSVISRTAGDLVPAVGVTGTGVTLDTSGASDPDPCVLLTVSTASGDIVLYFNGVPLTVSLASGASDAADAAQIAAAINADAYASTLVDAAVISGAVVTVSAKNAITLSSYSTPGAGVTVDTSGGASTGKGTVLTGSGTWGGIAGNAITNAAAGNITPSPNGALTTGATAVTITASRGGLSGNYITTVAGGAQAANVTASGARLTGGAETILALPFP